MSRKRTRRGRIVVHRAIQAGTQSVCARRRSSHFRFSFHAIWGSQARGAGQQADLLPVPQRSRRSRQNGARAPAFAISARAHGQLDSPGGGQQGGGSRATHGGPRPRCRGGEPRRARAHSRRVSAPPSGQRTPLPDRRRCGGEVLTDRFARARDAGPGAPAQPTDRLDGDADAQRGPPDEPARAIRRRAVGSGGAPAARRVHSRRDSSLRADLPARRRLRLGRRAHARRRSRRHPSVHSGRRRETSIRCVVERSTRWPSAAPAATGSPKSHAPF